MAQFPTYAPEFQVRINGEPLPAALRAAVGSISYQDGIEGADRVELTIANPGLRWLDHPLVQVDNGVRLFLGYAPDPLEEVFVGEITGVEPTFPNGSMPTIKIVAQDFLNRLTKGTKDRAFKIELPSIGNLPLPDLAVTGIVSGLNGLIPLPDPVGGPLSIVLALATAIAFPSSAQEGVRRQRGTSDFAFLSQIARENGWQMYIDHTAEPRGRILRFQFVVQDPTSTLTLKWGSSLKDFSPKLTTVGDVFGVSARVWVDTLQMEFVIVV
ncbi:MAG: phage late control D family protein, partial [Vicinamibacterales bacterium]